MMTKTVVGLAVLALAGLSFVPGAGASASDSCAGTGDRCCGEQNQFIDYQCYGGPDSFCEVWINGWCCDVVRNNCKIITETHVSTDSTTARLVAVRA